MVLVSIITASSDVVACDLEGGKALLDLQSGSYFSLNETGSTFWSLLASPVSYDDIFKSMLDLYDVDPAALDRDLRALVSELSEQGLITVEG